MGKILLAAKNINSVDEILELYKSSEKPRMKERYQTILWSLKNELTPTQIADLLFVHWRTVVRWINSFNNYGLEGLEMKKGAGRPSKLSKYAQKMIIGWIERKSPHDFGILDQVWTCPVISAVLQQELGIDIHSENIRLFLHRKGYSFKRPEAKHPNSNELKKINSVKKLENWKKS